jgi:hypothetical protein
VERYLHSLVRLGGTTQPGHVSYLPTLPVLSLGVGCGTVSGIKIDNRN